jgi:RNA polymerase sigma-70 factor (ECF subfamily)
MDKEFAFTELINNNRALIFKVCNLYCPDSEGRKDLFQEVVLQLWRSYPAFRGESASGTWIYRVALNTAISNFRTQSRTPGRKTLTLNEFEIPDMAGTADEKENRSALNLSIEKLTEN